MIAAFVMILSVIVKAAMNEVNTSMMAEIMKVYGYNSGYS